jgi:DNA primase
MAAGVVGRTSTGFLFDRFCGRVIFPIHDAQNRPLSFGGRILPESYGLAPGVPFSAKAKYVNGPETPVFAKSRMLYGLGQAWQAISRAGRTIVVEGYTDCILAHQFGFNETVAVLGTAFGEHHLRLLQRYTQQIVLLLDGDEAGRRRTNQLLELFLAADVDLRVVILPADTDPADFLLQFGPQALAELLAREAVDAFEHARRVFVGQKPPENLAASYHALDRILRLVAASPALRSEENKLREGLLLQRLSREFQIDEALLRSRLAELRRQLTGRQTFATATEIQTARAAPGELSSSFGRRTLPREDIPAPWQRELLEILFVAPSLIPLAAQHIPPEGIKYGIYREIYRQICRLAAEGEPVSLEQLLLLFEDPQVHSVLVCLEEDARQKGLEDPRAALEAFIATYQTRMVEQQIPVAARKLASESLSETEQLALLQQIIAVRRAAGGTALSQEEQAANRPNEPPELSPPR